MWLVCLLLVRYSKCILRFCQCALSYSIKIRHGFSLERPLSEVSKCYNLSIHFGRDSLELVAKRIDIVLVFPGGSPKTGECHVSFEPTRKGVFQGLLELPVLLAAARERRGPCVQEAVWEFPERRRAP